MPSVTQGPVVMVPDGKFCVNNGPLGLPILISIAETVAGADHATVTVGSPPIAVEGFGDR